MQLQGVLNGRKPIFLILMSMILLACLSIGVPVKKAEKNAQAEFYLSGSAVMENNLVSVVLTNKSPDGCDHLVVQGALKIDGLAEDSQGNALKVRIDPPGPAILLARIAASKPEMNLLTADQMMRFDFQIPEEHKNKKPRFIDLDVFVCVAPILGKTVNIEKCRVRLVVRAKP